MITKRQQNKIDKSKKEKVGFDLGISKSQVRKQSKNGGFLGALAGKFIPEIIAPLVTCAITTVGDVAMKKVMDEV